MIRPEPRLWRGLLRHDASPRARRFREQLGLPTDRPIVMTGHQAQFWHPGILAKYLAADAFAGAGQETERRKDGETRSAAEPSLAFLVVDQDLPARVNLRYPVVEQSGRLAVREAVWDRDGLGNGLRADGEVASVPGFVREGLEAIDAAMRAHAETGALPRRVALAARDLMAPYLSQRGRDAALLFATELCRTDLFRALVERMASEPERCVRAYNAAVARHPAAGVRPLAANEVQDRWELPLWWLPGGGTGWESPGTQARRHVYAEDLGAMAVGELAPKALFMTGLLRLAGCDLFIHGTGGGGGGEEGGYDRITDEWLRDWLGEAPAAAVTVVSATRFLPLEAPRPPSTPEVAKATWRLHHALHHPGEVGLEALEAQRQGLVAEIEVAAPLVRAELFQQLHLLLDRYRLQHAGELDALRQGMEEIRDRLHDAEVLHDRTWAFPLHPRALLVELRDEIAAAFRQDMFTTEAQRHRGKGGKC